MERRMLMAVVLSFLAVTAWSATTGGCQAPPQKKKDDKAATSAGEDGATPAEDDADALGSPTDDAGDDAGAIDDGAATDDAGDDDDAGRPAPADPVPEDPKPDTPRRPENGVIKPAPNHPHRNVKASTAHLKSHELDVGFTSLGGGIEYVRLNTVFEDDGKSPMDLVVPADPTMLMGQTDTIYLTPKTAPGGANRKNLPAGPMRTLHWKRDTQAESASPAEDVIYTFTHKGVTLQKAWSLTQGEKRFTVQLRLKAWVAEGGKPRTKYRVKMLAASGMLREVFRGAFGSPDNVMVFTTPGMSDVDISGLWGFPATELPMEGVNPTKLQMFGSRSTYFMTTYYADVAKGVSAPIAGFWATGEQGTLRPKMESTLSQWFHEARGLPVDAKGTVTDPAMKGRIEEGVKQMLHCWVLLELPIGKNASDPIEPVDMHFYTGPVDREILGQDAYNSLSPIVTYPSAPDIVAKFLLWIYDMWRNLTGSAGLAIILMTLVVRGGLMPLSIRNQLSMRSYGRKVKKVKPKLTALQEKYAKNPKRLREEQMKLYRENGVGFPSGCIMMLIQIPIFFSLFSALRVEYSIRGESFLWIKDLAGPDRLIDFGSTIVDLGIFRLDALNLLPILMVILSIWHTRSMPKPADDQQAQQMKMMKWMPIFFAFILYNYTAALALYMVFSSAIALIEAKIVRAKDAAAEEADDRLAVA